MESFTETVAHFLAGVFDGVEIGWGGVQDDLVIVGEDYVGAMPGGVPGGSILYVIDHYQARAADAHIDGIAIVRYSDEIEGFLLAERRLNILPHGA